MTLEEPQNRNLLLFGLAAFTLAPSFDTALKYLGPAGVAAFFVVGMVAIFAADRFVLPLYEKQVSERTATVMAAALFALLAIGAFLIYPIANSGRIGGGTDADDALIVAATRLVSGLYPYAETTYLGNLISPMPGTVLLSVPFVLTGSIWLQNIFWLALLFVVFRRFEGGSKGALPLIAIMLVFSATLLQNIATGADYASNSIYILVAMWLMLRFVPDENGSLWAKLLSAILLGTGLSSRSTFMLIMPVFLSALVQNSGWAKAIKYLAVSGITFLAVTLPFWIADPAGFAPLAVQSDKLKAVEHILPFASIVIPGSAGVLAIALSFQNMHANTARFFRNCAFVQIFVLFFTSIVYSIKLGHLDLFLQQSGYGMFAMIFGSTAYWMYLNNGPNVAQN